MTRSRATIWFYIRTGRRPSNTTDVRILKTLDVNWSGRPMPGEGIDIGIGLPIAELGEMKVDGVTWSIEEPLNVRLKPLDLSPEEVQWDGGLDGYIDYCRKNDWEVFDPRPRS